VVLGHIALGKHDVVVSDSSHPDFSLIEAEILGISTFLGQREDQHGNTLSKNVLLVHLWVVVALATIVRARSVVE